MLKLAQDDLAYYDKIIAISRDRFKAGDIAQIDLDRIELLRVQYESELQTAIVNLRTAKIQLLQLLNDHTPVAQFDVTGPFDFSDALQPLSRLPPDRPGQSARPAGRARDLSSSRRPTTNWPLPTDRPTQLSARGTRGTHRTITRTPSACRLSAPA